MQKLISTTVIMMFTGSVTFAQKDPATDSFIQLNQKRLEKEQENAVILSRVELLRKKIAEDSLQVKANQDSTAYYKKAVAENSQLTQRMADSTKKTDAEIKQETGKVKELKKNLDMLTLEVDSLVKKSSANIVKILRTDSLSKELAKAETLKKNLLAQRVAAGDELSRQIQNAAVYDPLYKRNELLSSIVLKDLSEKVKEATANAEFDPKDLAALEEQGKKLPGISNTNETFNILNNRIKKYKEAGTFIKKAREMLKKEYKPAENAKLLKDYEGIETYKDFTQDQKDELVFFTSNLRGYCQEVWNDIFSTIKEADELIKKGKRPEAKKKLLEKAGLYREDVFVFVIAELKRLSNFSTSGKNLTMNSKIQEIPCN